MADKMNLYQKLTKAKDSFHKLEIKKTGENKFANYKYMQLADFMSPIVAELAKVELVSYVTFNEEVATLIVVDCDNIESKMELTSPMSTASLKGCHPVQNLGASQTYIRRYLYSALFDIVEGDAIDSSEPVIKVDCNKLISTGSKKGFKSADIEKSLIKSYGHGMEHITQKEHDAALKKLEALKDK